MSARVTVPVEPTGVSPVYSAAYDSIRKGAPGLSDAACAAIARSINMKVSCLSAAPAPEGGAVWFGVSGAVDETEALAVALFDARCPGIRMTDEDLHYYRSAAQRAMQAVADELDTPALAAREEAPAEAGELIDHLEAYRPHLADEGVGSIYVSMTLSQLDDILSALRAQPQARSGDGK